MPSAPASPDPGPDEVSGLNEDEPAGPDEEYDDPEHPAMPWDLDVAAIWAETDELAAADAADAENLARRGDQAVLAALAAADAGAGAVAVPGSPGPRAGFPAAPIVPRAGSAPGSPSMSRRAGRPCWASPNGSPTTRSDSAPRPMMSLSG